MPAFLERLSFLEHARDFTGRFVQAYNTLHRHSGCGFHTLVDVVFGMTAHIDDQRLTALEQAWAAEPERFSRARLPKKVQLLKAEWANEPVELEIEDAMTPV